MDLVVRSKRIPAPGETVLGESFEMLPGGKGGNQAYAAAKLGGAQVAMIGKVGRDLFGEKLKANLAAVGVDVTSVDMLDGVPTGIASITVDAEGQNSIVVASGANFVWGLEELEGKLRGARLVLLQLEIPIDVVTRLARMAKRAGAYTILDPAPARELPRELIEAVDLLTPNESEARGIGEIAGKALLVKLGERGSRCGDLAVPAIAVQAVDTTGAGDVYNGALAVGLSEGMGMEQAMRFASVAAGLSVRKMGAQTAVPGRAEVDAYGLSW